MSEKDGYWDCLDRAMEASHGGDPEAALAWLDEALKSRPGGAEAHNGRGEILWDEGKIHEALHELELSSQADPKFLTAHLNRAELLIEEMGEYEQALEQCDRLLSGSPELARPDRGIEAEIYYLKAKALFYLDDLEGALFLVRRALKAGGQHGTYRAFEGQLCFELGRFEESRALLEAAAVIDPESAHAAYHLGLVLERLESPDPAREAFARANALDPEHYPLPLEIDSAEFEQIAARALDDLPRSIHEYVENVPVLIEDFPSRELIETYDLSPQILGLYQGVPGTEGGVTEQPQEVTRVALFKRNLEKVCRSREELAEQIQVTVKHEIGHHLGLDEEDLDRLGLG
ncbi:MAG: metallopeptidase family protein [Myxococcota bacterium]